MTDLLYQDLIMEHSREPCHCGVLDQPTHAEEGYNPLCGDQVHVSMRVEGQHIAALECQASGCAISIAAASLMAEFLQGVSVSEVSSLFESYHSMVMTGLAEESSILGDLEALVGVSQYPMRVKCATMCWHTLLSALQLTS